MKGDLEMGWISHIVACSFNSYVITCWCAAGAVVPDAYTSPPVKNGWLQMGLIQQLCF